MPLQKSSLPLETLAVVVGLRRVLPLLTSLTPKGRLVLLPRVLLLAMDWWWKDREDPTTCRTCPLTLPRLLGAKGPLIRKLQQKLLPTIGLMLSPVPGQILRMVRVTMRAVERCTTVRLLLELSATGLMALLLVSGAHRLWPLLPTPIVTTPPLLVNSLMLAAAVLILPVLLPMATETAVRVTTRFPSLGFVASTRRFGSAN